MSSKAFTAACLTTGAVAAATQWLPALSGVPAVTRWLPPHTPPSGTVWLSFDDGPHPGGTRAMLEVLREHDARATFFVVGEQVLQHTGLTARISAEGHQLGVHGWNHRCVARMGPRTLVREIGKTVELIETLAGRRPTRYRPPYGVFSGSAVVACRELELAPTWWSRWGRDWSPHADAGSIVRHVDRRPGPVSVLLHDSDRYGSADSWKQTAAALDTLLVRWRRRGFTVTALPELVCGGGEAAVGPPAIDRMQSIASAVRGFGALGHLLVESERQRVCGGPDWSPTGRSASDSDPPRRRSPAGAVLEEPQVQ